MTKRTYDIVAELERLLSRQIEALAGDLTPEVVADYGERNQAIRTLLRQLVTDENSRN